MDSLGPATVPADDGARHWRRNLAVCVFGSFATLISMTLLLPFLPLFVESLGVHDQAAIVEWSSAAYGATFLAAGLVSPIWGRLADIYGRKPMLIRASLGMAVAMSLIGMAANIWQLVAYRFLAGLVGGYSSSSMVFMATQAPRARTGWALGILSSGITAGSLVGPLIGGFLPPLIGIRATFYVAGAVIFLAFIATVTLIHEEPRTAAAIKARKAEGGWRAIPDKRPIVAMLLTNVLLMAANMTLEPIITIYVRELEPAGSQITVIAGLVMSASALGIVLSAPRLGKLADRIGHWPVINACLAISALLLIPQAFVTQGWQLIVLRFLMGLSLGGLSPCIASVIRHNVPESIVGTILGYSTSAQFVGLVVGPILGGVVGAHLGLSAVFIATAGLLGIGALYNQYVRLTMRRRG